MWAMTYPIIIIVASNVLYNVVTKSTPRNVNVFASMAVTYAVGATVCFAVFFATAKDKHFFAELHKANWATFALGLVIVGLEIGYILAYRNGWQMNVLSVTANIILAVALIAVSLVFYKESITLKQLAGIALCAGGLVLINV